MQWLPRRRRTRTWARPWRPGGAVLVAAALAALGLASCRREAPRPSGAPFGISVPYEVGSLDPHRRDWASAFAVASHFYEPLVTVDANLGLVPALARRWENPDARTWLFEIRPGVRFHSGKPLTAEDVVYSFERLKAGRDLEIAGYASSVVSARALLPLVVELKTGAPNAVLLNALRFVSIVPAGSGFATMEASANGTGPYRLAAWKPGEEIDLVRNDDYWGERPALPRVVMRLARRPEEAARDFLEGRSQLVQLGARGVEEDLVKRAGVPLLRRTSLFTKYLGFDLDGVSGGSGMRPSPFLDRRVRQALHLAIDRAALTSRLSTHAVPASQLVPPLVFGYDPSLPPPSHDVDRARRLLAEAGYPGGLDATLHTRKRFEEPARLLAEILAPAGFRLTVLSLPDEEFFAAVEGHATELFFTRRGCPAGDLGNLLENTAHTFDPEKGLGMANDGRTSDPRLDALIEESSAILDTAGRSRALHALMRALMNDLTLVPLYFDEDVYALAKGYAWQPRADSYVLSQEVRPKPAR